MLSFPPLGDTRSPIPAGPVARRVLPPSPNLPGYQP